MCFIFLSIIPLIYFSQVRDQVGEAVKLVEQFLQSSRSVVVVPNLVSLGQLSETPPAKPEENGSKTAPAPSILLRWEMGTQVGLLSAFPLHFDWELSIPTRLSTPHTQFSTQVPVEELVCQAAYDLGVYYFHICDYEKAGFLLQTCGNLFSQVKKVWAIRSCKLEVKQ